MDFQPKKLSIQIVVDTDEDFTRILAIFDKVLSDYHETMKPKSLAVTVVDMEI